MGAARGRVDPGETMVQAAAHGSVEETGVPVAVGGLLAVCVHEGMRDGRGSSSASLTPPLLTAPPHGYRLPNRTSTRSLGSTLLLCHRKT